MDSLMGLIGLLNSLGPIDQLGTIGPRPSRPIRFKQFLFACHYINRAIPIIWHPLWAMGDVFQDSRRAFQVTPSDIMHGTCIQFGTAHSTFFSRDAMGSD